MRRLKLFTIVGRYPNGETFVDWWNANGPKDAIGMTYQERQDDDIEIIAVFAGHIEDLYGGGEAP